MDRTLSRYSSYLRNAASFVSNRFCCLVSSSCCFSSTLISTSLLLYRFSYCFNRYSAFLRLISFYCRNWQNSTSCTWISTSRFRMFYSMSLKFYSSLLIVMQSTSGIHPSASRTPHAPRTCSGASPATLSPVIYCRTGGVVPQLPFWLCPLKSLIIMQGCRSHPPKRVRHGCATAILK